MAGQEGWTQQSFPNKVIRHGVRDKLLMGLSSRINYTDRRRGKDVLGEGNECLGMWGENQHKRGQGT